MKKATALALLGGNALAASKHLGCTRQAVYKWPEDKPLPRSVADRVLAAHVRQRAADLRMMGHPIDELEADAVAL